jgi:hypothetical protein
MRSVSTDKQTRCCFRLADVICPDSDVIQQQLTPGLEVSGQVVFLSDRGSERDSFAIVEVEGITAPLIVPVERLRGWDSR